MIVNKVLGNFRIVWGNKNGVQGMSPCNYYDAVYKDFSQMLFTNKCMWIEFLYCDGETEYLLQSKSVSKFGLSVIQGSGQVLNCELEE